MRALPTISALLFSSELASSRGLLPKGCPLRPADTSNWVLRKTVRLSRRAALPLVLLMPVHHAHVDKLVQWLHFRLIWLIHFVHVTFPNRSPCQRDRTGWNQKDSQHVVQAVAELDEELADSVTRTERVCPDALAQRHDAVSQPLHQLHKWRFALASACAIVLLLRELTHSRLIESIAPMFSSYAILALYTICQQGSLLRPGHACPRGPC